jgi:hypothetical protein
MNSNDNKKQKEEIAVNNSFENFADQLRDTLITSN